ncbi:MAG TPA: hypothetical protein VKZ41_02845 [Gemmatimonadales bacterium]|nr:hypothetical protein [Gemmatimonadales bacterium]
MAYLRLPNASQWGPARFRRLAGIVLATFAVSACGGDDPFEPTLSVVEETVEVFAINGSDPGLPNAMALVTSTGTGRLAPFAFRATPNFFFDFAVDLDEAGTATLYPMLLVGSILGGTHEVGLRPYDIPFEELRTAPTDGYVFGEAFELSEGDVFAAVSVQAPVCRTGLYIIPNVYAKLRVEEIDTVARSVTFRVVADPSCGFRRLTPPTTN